MLFLDQGRIDGVFCDFTNKDKLDFLQTANEKGVVNMEMESLCFSAILSHAKIPCNLFKMNL